MKRLLKFSMVLASMTLLLASCNCYHRMAKKADRVQATCNPAVLSLKGSDVTAEIKVTFPPKYFDEMAVLKITPVLVFDGGEIAGTPKYVQGEDVADNYTVIPWKAGGVYAQTVTFPYDQRAQLSTLELRFESRCANKCKKNAKEFVPFTSLAVAKGISTLQNDANDLAYMSIMPDQYKKMKTYTQEADILYDINKAVVKPAQLSKDQIKLFEDFVKENANQPKAALGNVYSKGYASPDGPVKFNDDLSKKRSESGKEAISPKFDGTNVKYDIAAYGEDWDGFKKAVENSNVQDKELILKVLEMYQSPVEREAQIKNMSAVFKVLAQDVLPQLRRTQFSATANVQDLNDSELKAAVAQGGSNLTLEQLLYAATLVNSNSDKEAIYKTAAQKFNEVRAYNNLGVVQAWQGKLADAKNSLAQAAKLSSAPEISNNLGAVALAQGDLAEAKKYLSSLNTADAKGTQALLALAEGDYNKATKGLTGYDLAVAQTLDGNLSAAKTAIANDQSAAADYLRAEIAAREGDAKAAIANLKSSISKDSSYKAKAQKNVEFIKLFGTPEFMAL